MEKKDKTQLAPQTPDCFQNLMNEIFALENLLSELPDQFEYLTSDQKNQIFHEFERLSQNLTSLSSWLSRPIYHRAKFKMSSNLKILISQEEGSITFKFLETSKNQN